MMQQNVGVFLPLLHFVEELVGHMLGDAIGLGALFAGLLDPQRLAVQRDQPSGSPFSSLIGTPDVVADNLALTMREPSTMAG
jgi:hypothetical protein